MDTTKDSELVGASPISRRKAIAGIGAGAAALWVTPAIVHTAVASAAGSPTHAVCNDTTSSGGEGTQTTEYEMGATSGTFCVSYDMYGIPDQMEIFYESGLIFTTGGLVSGTGQALVNFGPGTSTKIQVKMTAPNSGTLWIYSVQCPGEACNPNTLSSGPDPEQK